MKQVQMAHALSPSSSCKIYHDTVKGFKWCTTVRVKLDDPAYASWFLKSNCSASSPTPAPRTLVEGISSTLHRCMSMPCSNGMWTSTSFP